MATQRRVRIEKKLKKKNIGDREKCGESSTEFAFRSTRLAARSLFRFAAPKAKL